MISESQVNELLERRASKQAEKEKIIENAEEYRVAVNKIFTTPEGEIFYKYLVKFCRVYGYEGMGNTVKMVEDNGRRAVFLEAVRPFLNKETRVKLEDIV